VTNAWTELLKKGELNIGRVLFKNIFTIQPRLVKLFNPEDLSQAELFKNHEFHQECTKTVWQICLAIGNLNKIDDMIPTFINLGENYLKKEVTLEDYTVVLKAMQLTLKAGLQ
jgi:hemoglobin-like flavoprotein